MLKIYELWKDDKVNELDLVKQASIYNNDNYAQNTIELFTKEE